MTGSLDSSVKLWEIRGPAQAESGGGLVRSDPLAVFSEMEGAVRCVALNDAANLVAAGGEDGTLIVWDLKSGTVLFSSLVVESKRYPPLRTSLLCRRLLIPSLLCVHCCAC